MKTSILVASFAAAFTLNSLGSQIIFQDNFDSYTSGSALVPNGGWDLNMTDTEANLTGVIGSGDLRAELGGRTHFPSTANKNIELAHALAAYPASLTAITLDFAIAENIGSPTFLDSFGYSLKSDSGANIFSVSFAKGTLGGDGGREIFHNGTSLNSLVYTYKSGAPLPAPGYSLSLTFSASGADLVYSGSIIGSPNSATFGGVVPGMATANIGKFVVDFDIAGPTSADAGFNSITTNNIVVTIPEPGALGLAGLGLIGLLGRRRRK
jgi:hypothetical protein